ncbi:uncharacterized protein CLUP02_10757 [Colletotrichum lupini]|uniref:Uncharacterized protein n=1 Tax=Colletotrichum lupini TaxID=145971 RepID=A0A9Q8SXJ3_9PEZI|nr:uncharacterized protein CLUP02_10757 [Colletotrichum lupini]UQC85260.1 hypothetical protein CLUP02_10757 [Colletotrichum lupini]
MESTGSLFNVTSQPAAMGAGHCFIRPKNEEEEEEEEDEAKKHWNISCLFSAATSRPHSSNTSQASAQHRVPVLDCGTLWAPPEPPADRHSFASRIPKEGCSTVFGPWHFSACFKEQAPVRRDKASWTERLGSERLDERAIARTWDGVTQDQTEHTYQTSREGIGLDFTTFGYILPPPNSKIHGLRLATHLMLSDLLSTSRQPNCRPYDDDFLSVPKRVTTLAVAGSLTGQNDERLTFPRHPVPLFWGPGVVYVVGERPANIKMVDRSSLVVGSRGGHARIKESSPSPSRLRSKPGPPEMARSTEQVGQDSQEAALTDPTGYSRTSMDRSSCFFCLVPIDDSLRKRRETASAKGEDLQYYGVLLFAPRPNDCYSQWRNCSHPPTFAVYSLSGLSRLLASMLSQVPRAPSAAPSSLGWARGWWHWMNGASASKTCRPPPLPPPRTPPEPCFPRPPLPTSPSLASPEVAHLCLALRPALDVAVQDSNVVFVCLSSGAVFACHTNPVLDQLSVPPIHSFTEDCFEVHPNYQPTDSSRLVVTQRVHTYQGLLRAPIDNLEPNQASHAVASTFPDQEA